MNKKVLSLLILFFSGIMLGNAQNDGKITIKGTVIDQMTNQPLAFVNMGLLGTMAGVASDIDGNFELVVPDRYATHVIKFSAVGYAPYEMKVYEAKDKVLKVALKPVSYGLREAEVYAEGLMYKKLLRDVVANISKVYIAKPYNYTGYFKYGITVNNEAEKVKESIVNIYDSKGYNRNDVATTFKEINYNFNQVRRSEPAKSVFDGMTYFDDILTADIVRNTRNVLDVANIDEFKLKNKGILMYEGDSVQVISYELSKPTLSTTGDVAVSQCKGEIFINKKDKAVLKNVIQIKAKDFNILGRNLVAINEAPKSDVEMVISTNYKKLKSVYFLSGITIAYKYKQEGNEVKGEMQYITTRVNMDAPTPIAGRLYYEDLKTDAAFWNGYTAYFEE